MHLCLIPPHATSVLDQNVLPAVYVADLYRRRWRIVKKHPLLSSAF